MKLSLCVVQCSSPAPASPCFSRYLFTLDLPEFWENKHADQTLEVLMSDLDPAVMDQFYMKDGVSANDVTRVRTAFYSQLVVASKRCYSTHSDCVF